MEETKTLQEEYSPTDAKREKVRRVAVAMIDDFPEHPFKVKDDEEMEKLKDSISLYGVLTPVVARRCENGRYELISGHRRKYACKALGIEFIPAIVREMSREEAVIAMVDSNLQREHILPSEKAFAYKMKLEALKCQGKRNDLTCDPLGHKLDGLKSRQILADGVEDSATQIQRYIRLTELVPELLELVDDGRMAFRPAVEISYLTEDEQRDLVETIDSEDCTPSLSQACRMKKLSQEGKLDMDAIFAMWMYLTCSAVFLTCFPPDTTEYPKSSHLYTAISRSMKVAFFIAKIKIQGGTECTLK